MLDSIKSLAGGKGKALQQQIDELATLVGSAREERSAISAMLDALAAKSAKISPIGKQLEQVSVKATAVTTQLDGIAFRLSTLDDRASSIAELDKRIQALSEAARQAEETTQQALGPHGELHKHREAVQQLVRETSEAHAAVDALTADRTTLEECRGQLRSAKDEIGDSMALAARLREDMERMGSGTAALQQEYQRLTTMAGEARSETAATLATASEVEEKLAPLAEMYELGQRTEERLTALNTLAEHVSHKTKALESQQQAVEHAVVQSNRVTEMVWAMDAQLAKLNEGLKQTAKAEETIGRIEQITQDVNAQVESVTRARQDAERDATKFTKDVGLLLDSLREQASGLGLRAKEFEAFDERVRLLANSVSEAEGRVQAVATEDGIVTVLIEKAEKLAARFDVMSREADELAAKQLALENLHERLDQVEGLARKTETQLDALQKGRQEIDQMRSDVQMVSTRLAEIVQVRDKLQADKTALEAVGERMSQMAALAPQLDARMRSVLDQATAIEDGLEKASRVGTLVAELDAQIARVSARAPFVDGVETRLNGLHTLVADIDSKLADQLAKRAELETLEASIETTKRQAQHARDTLTSVQAVQAKLSPMVGAVETLEKAVNSATHRIKSIKYDEDAVNSVVARLERLTGLGQEVAGDVEQRAHQIQQLSDELVRAAGLRDELIAEMDRVVGRQREAVTELHDAEEQLTRTEQLCRQLETRHAWLAAADKKVASVETRLDGLEGIAARVEKIVEHITTREQLVRAVKAEIEGVHAISERSKADLAHVLEHRAEVASLRQQVDLLLTRIGETSDRTAAIDARRKIIEEVHTKVTASEHLLDDLRLNLEMLGEHKAVVDHVAEEAARLDFMLKEARGAVRTLQHEREMAERIERGLKQMRSKRVANAEERRSA